MVWYNNVLSFRGGTYTVSIITMEVNASRRLSLLSLLSVYVILKVTVTASQRYTIRGAVTSAESSTFMLPLANVSLIGPLANRCEPLSLLTSRLGTFEFSCTADPTENLSMVVWARQYEEQILRISSKLDFFNVALLPRHIPGFPGKLWRFDGWAVQAETGDVPGTNISFLSHPSAFRTPSGRVFMISTAGSTTGQKPGWTQGYWQSKDGVQAVACKGPLITESHPGVEGVSMSARLIYADGRLLMVTGIEIPSQHRMVTILENKNLDDPSHSEDWVGLGVIKVNFTGAPTSVHEDYRLHILEGHQRYTCNGQPRKYWLLIIPDHVPGVPGRACGRMAFASESLTGPYTWCDWSVSPNNTACDAFPGDLIPGLDSMYFAESYGSLYKGNMSGPLTFDMLPEKIVVPGPRGEWDDLGQVALTFLLPDQFSNRARLYHASYSTVSTNPNASKKDFGYKLAIGMYSFEWKSIGKKVEVNG